MKAKTLTNTNLIEEVSFVPQTKSTAYEWTEYYRWIGFWTAKTKSQKEKWAWRKTELDTLYVEPYLRFGEYKDDYELVRAHPHFAVEGKSLYVKAHISIRFSSGKEITKWFPNDEMAQLYWDREIATLPNFKDISEPKNYTDV